MKAKIKTVCLFLESASDFSIKDQSGKIVALAEAKRLFELGAVEDWNVAFGRLAQFGFDLEATKKYYADSKERWLTQQKVSA